MMKLERIVAYWEKGSLTEIAAAGAIIDSLDFSKLHAEIQSLPNELVEALRAHIARHPTTNKEWQESQWVDISSLAPRRGPPSEEEVAAIRSETEALRRYFDSSSE
jgi:hypothetical protein